MALETDCIILTDWPVPQSKPGIIGKGWRDVGLPDRKPFGNQLEGKPYCILSTVCRQLYDETCLLPYALNTFSPITLKRMDAWLSLRLPVQCNAIVSFKVTEAMVEDYWFDRHYTFSSMSPNIRRLYVDLWPLPRRHAQPLAPCTDTQLAEIITGLESHLEQKEDPGVSIIATRCHIGGEGVFRSIRGL
jgi:hypothetical protein